MPDRDQSSSESSQPARPIETTCPRCGYDLRGAVESWTDRCPRDGTCNECGLQFRWSNVVTLDVAEPRWSVEHRRGLLGIPVGSLLTLLHSAAPWLFWTRLRMHHRIRPTRLVTYVGMLILLPALLLALHQASLAVQLRWRMGEVVRDARPDTRKTMLRRAVHDLNKDSPAEPRILTEEEIDEIEARAIAANQVRFSYLDAIFEAVFRPQSTSSRGSYLWAIRGPLPYPAPDELHTRAFSARSPSTWGAPVHGFMSIPRGIRMDVPLLGLLAVPLGMVLIPATRRREKVRWAHIARIATYSLGLPVGVLCIGTGFATIAYLWPRQYHWLHSLTTTMVWLLTPALAAWWWFALGRYLKMDRPGRIIVIFFGVALMTYVTVRMLTNAAGFLEELMWTGLL